MAIDKDMLIGDLIQVDDSIAPILMRAGMHCLGCPASQGESLEEACIDVYKRQGVLGNTAAHYSQMEQGTLDFFLTGFDTATVLKEGTDFSVCVVPFLFEDLDLSLIHI